MSGEMRVLEIRTYRLVPGTRAVFDREKRTRSLPLHAAHGIRVVRWGPSLIEDDQYILIRAFASLEERETQLAALYNSKEWLREHAPVLEPMIDSFQTVLLSVGDEVLAVLEAG